MVGWGAEKKGRKGAAVGRENVIRELLFKKAAGKERQEAGREDERITIKESGRKKGGRRQEKYD